MAASTRKRAKSPVGRAVASPVSNDDIAGIDSDGLPIQGPPSATMFTSEPGEVSRVRVYREHDATRKWTTHGFLATDECTEELVAQMFGGGKWVCQKMLTDQVTGRVAIASTKMFFVPGPYKAPTGPLPGLDTPQAAAPGAPGAPALVSLAPHGVNVKEYLDNVLLLRSMEKPSAINWEAIIASATTLAVAIINKESKPDSTATALASFRDEVRTQLADIKKAPGPATAGINDALQAMEGLLGLKDAIVEARGGGGEPKSEGEGMWGALSKLADAVMSAKGQQVPPSPALPPGPGGVDPAATPTMPPWQQLLLEYAARLQDAAGRGLEPDFVAEMTARFVPEHQRGILTELMMQPNVRDLVVTVIPAMQHYPTWLDAFLKDLRAEMLGEAEPEPETSEVAE